MQTLRGLQWSAVQALGSRHVEIRLIDRSHLYEGREVPKHLVNFGGILAIAFGMSVDKNCLRTKLRGGAQGHSRVHAEFSGGVGCGGDYSALVALSADDYRLSL